MTIKNNSRICLIVSAVILVIALVMSLLGAGIHFGADFAGGAHLSYNLNQAFNPADVEAALRAQGVAPGRLTYSGENDEILQIRIADIEGGEALDTLQSGLEAALLEKYPNMDTEASTADTLGPVVNASFLTNALIGVLLVALFVLLYVAFRFDISNALAAAFGMLHDALVLVSLAVILRSIIKVNISFVAAVLAVIAFSINNILVLLDRIREDKKLPACRDFSREELVSFSVKQGLSRTIFSSLALLVIFVALYVLGTSSIREFSLPIIIGILISVYSTNLISGYVWAFLADRLKNKKKAKRKTKKA